MCEEAVDYALQLFPNEDDNFVIKLEDAIGKIDFNDVVQVIRTLPDGEKVLRLFSADCAEVVLPVWEEKYPEDLRPRRAIEAARRYALGEASKKELNEAYWAANSAANSTPCSVADSTPFSTADWAADSAARYEVASPIRFDKLCRLLLRYHQA